MEGEGFKITYLPVNKNGLISLDDLVAAITPETSLVSVMTINNEIGVKQPIREIGVYVILSIEDNLILIWKYPVKI